MPRARQKDNFLPTGVYRHGKRFRMRIYDQNKRPAWHTFRARTVAGMLKEHLQYLKKKKVLRMHDVFDRYEAQEVPEKALATQESDRKALKALRRAFGSLAPNTLDAPLIVDYVDARRHSGPVRANREVALLSHICTRCRHWGILETNPVQRLHYRNPELPRDRYVESGELWRAMRIAPPIVRYVMWLGVLTGLRRADLLGLKPDNFSDDGLIVTLSKSQRRGARPKTLLFEWSTSLERLYRRVSALHTQPNGDVSFFPITVSRFERIWTRFQDRVEALGIARFEMKDLRAKFGTDRDERTQDATRALAHASSATTKRHYQRKPVRITL